MVPESTSGMMNWASKTSCSLRSEISCQWWNGLVVVARVICKFNGDGFCGSFGHCTVEFLNRSFSFHALIESYKSNTFWQTYIKNKKSNSSYSPYNYQWFSRKLSSTVAPTKRPFKIFFTTWETHLKCPIFGFIYIYLIYISKYKIEILEQIVNNFLKSKRRQ